MKQLVADAMKQGALGFRLRCNTSRRGLRRPMRSSSWRKSRGSTAASTSRINAAKRTRSMNRCAKFSRLRVAQTCPTEIWHLKTAYKKNWGRMPEMLAKIRRARASGLDITADVYPYIAGSTSLSACLPPWALEGGTEKMLARLRDMRIRQQLKKEITTDPKEWENIYLGSGGPSGILIGSVVNRELEALARQTPVGNRRGAKQRSAGCAFRFDPGRSRANRRDLFHDERSRHDARR